MLSEEESREKFESADENEDGKVTWEEYLLDSYGIQDENDRNNMSDDEYEEEQKVGITICFRCRQGQEWKIRIQRKYYRTGYLFVYGNDSLSVFWAILFHYPAKSFHFIEMTSYIFL